MTRNPYQGTPYRGKGPVYDTESQESEAFRGGAPEPGPSGMQSGSVALSLDAIVATRPASAQQIVRWNAVDQYPSPLTAIVDVRSSAGSTPSNPFAAPAHLIAQGDGQVASGALQGVLRFTYGAGAAQRVIELDLKSGNFQLPPCTTCTVEAFLYGNGPGSAQVSAALVPGRHENPTRPTNTVRTVALAPAAEVTLKVPFGARWAALYAGTPTQIAAGQPSALLSQASGAVVILDWASGVLVPAPGVFAELPDRTDVIARNVGAAAILTVRFGLEL